MKALKYCQTAILKTAREHTFLAVSETMLGSIGICGTDDDVESFATESLLELEEMG
jgi:hypothetical protein